MSSFVLFCETVLHPSVSAQFSAENAPKTIWWRDFARTAEELTALSLSLLSALSLSLSLRHLSRLRGEKLIHENGGKMNKTGRRKLKKGRGATMDPNLEIDVAPLVMGASLIGIFISRSKEFKHFRYSELLLSASIVRTFLEVRVSLDRPRVC
jgi:hypothetical protein